MNEDTRPLAAATRPCALPSRSPTTQHRRFRRSCLGLTSRTPVLDRRSSLPNRVGRKNTVRNLRLIHLIDGEIDDRRNVQLKGRMTMLATRTSRKNAKRLSNVTLTDNDAFDVDTVSPHDKDALRVVAENMGTQDRLPSLIRGAARSRDLCEVHRCAARESIRAARSAKKTGNGISYREYMKAALDARRRASECHRFARECEERANALIMAGCSPRAEVSTTQSVIPPDTSHGLFPKWTER